MAQSAGQLATLARAALGKALERSTPAVTLDAKGYVADAAQNLVSGVALSDFEADLRQGDGNELEGKFRAAHSSSALAANNFAPFKFRPVDLQLAGFDGFSTLQFERKCHHGLVNRRAPNLDLVAESSHHILAVESKCLEYLSPHKAEFADAYESQITDARRAGPWFAHMLTLNAQPNTYRWLDAAQLVKHAFGLAHTFPSHHIALLYLFW